MATVFKEEVHLLAYASALGGVNAGCAKGPLYLAELPELKAWQQQLHQEGLALNWDLIVKPDSEASANPLQALERLNLALALKTEAYCRAQERFIVSGGDHTSAIGTWSGVSVACGGDVGLIWIDAHMDSHTPQTSLSGRVHGMPLAVLLGEGEARFTALLAPFAKVKPGRLCLIGTRSYEAGEEALLKRLGVRIFYMPEIKERGLAAVFEEALALMRQGSGVYGVSLDLDGLDPLEAPGVDVPEPDGLSGDEVALCLKRCAADPAFVGVELVEFNPERDLEGLTAKRLIEYIKILSEPNAKR